MAGASPATTIGGRECPLRDIVVAGLAPAMQNPTRTRGIHTDENAIWYNQTHGSFLVIFCKVKKEQSMANFIKSPCDEGVIRSAPGTVSCHPDIGRWVLVATIMGSS